MQGGRYEAASLYFIAPIQTHPSKSLINNVGTRLIASATGWYGKRGHMGYILEKVHQNFNVSMHLYAF